MRDLPSADALKSVAETSLDDDKAEDIVVIDLAGRAGFADYMVIATGRSDRHVHAMADRLIRKMKQAGLPSVPAEGIERSDWVLIDGGDVIVHLFKPEVRSFYNLEKLWNEEAGARDESAQDGARALEMAG
ncbi:MAG: ribosome silencing factor [Rhodospirillaceae bacterium]|nr:ribosome silencing factor [Rhodospirillaceae bacterium]